MPIEPDRWRTTRSPAVAETADRTTFNASIIDHLEITTKEEHPLFRFPCYIDFYKL